MSGAYVCGDGNGINSCNSNRKIHAGCNPQLSKRSSSGTRYSSMADVSNKSSCSGPQDESNMTSEERNYYREITEQIRLFQGQCSSLKEKLLHSRESETNAIEEEPSIRRIPAKNSSGTSQSFKVQKRSHGQGDYENKISDHRACHTPRDLSTYDEISTSARQQSDSIESDTTDAAVVTINNILHGITNSVNRLSDLKFHITSDSLMKSSTQQNQGHQQQYIQPQQPAVPKQHHRQGHKKRPLQFQDTGCGPDTERDTSTYSAGGQETSQESCTISDPSAAQEPPNVFRKRHSPASTKVKVKKRSQSNKCKIKTSSASLVSKKKNKSAPMKAPNVYPEKSVKMTTRRHGKDVRDSASISREAEDVVEQVRRTPKRSRQRQGCKQASRTSVASGVKKVEMTRKGMQKSAEGLIELYHNNELRESDSDESGGKTDVRNGTSHSKRHSSSYMSPRDATQVLEKISQMGHGHHHHHHHQDRGDVPKKPSISQHSQIHHSHPQPQPHQQYDDVHAGRSLSPIEEVDFSDGTKEHGAASIAHASMMSKNYELPTIASKMKQVCKSCLNNFNFQSIPFIASTSTSPSHNLGINIQQVMSIFKTKHPVNGVSPTLVHNLGVAANRLGGRPYSALLSSLGSRLGNRIERLNCPLNNRMNFSHLQEIAKEIPEEYDIDDQGDNCVSNAIMYNAAAGEPNNQRIWQQQDETSRQCTCISPGGLPIEEVLNKHQHQQQLSWNNAYYQNQYYDRRKVNSRNRSQTRAQTAYPRPFTAKSQTTKSRSPSVASDGLPNQEKNLKEVLRNLHDEFEQMNNKYDGLEKLSKEGNNKVLAEMEHLEKDLAKKEEEIEVVMGLYSEVVNLKRQIKIMKQEDSTHRLSYPPSRQGKKSPRTTIHLTKLLRQIQNYQQVHRSVGESCYC